MIADDINECDPIYERFEFLLISIFVSWEFESIVPPYNEWYPSSLSNESGNFSVLIFVLFIAPCWIDLMFGGRIKDVSEVHPEKQA